GDDQNRIEAHVLELGRSQLSFRRIECERINDGNAIFAGQLRQNRTDTGAIHLLVDLVREVLFGRTWESTTAPTPQWGGRHTGAGAARTLLTPRLAGGVLDGCAVLLGTVATTGIGLESDDNLVYQRFVELATEHGVGCGNGGSGLTLVIQELE